MAQVFRFADSGNKGEMLESMIDDLSIDSDEQMKYKHVTAAHGDDRTLCGLAYGEYMNLNGFKSGRITCPDCLQIIKYCKSFRSGADFLPRDMNKLNNQL